MRPSIEIETFYANTQKGFWAADEMLAVAKLCEDWAISVDSHPDESHAKPKGSEIPVDLLVFATAMALLIPSERTGIIFEKHEVFLNQNENDMRRIANEVVWAFGYFLPDYKAVSTSTL